MTAKQEEKAEKLKDVLKLHPIERQKLLRRLLSAEKDVKFLRLIKEELKKAELEEENLQSSGEAPAKKEEKEEQKNLDTLVETFDVRREREEKRDVLERLYVLNKDEHRKPAEKLYETNAGKTYEAYSTYKPIEQEPIHIEVTSTSSEKSGAGFGKEEISTGAHFREMKDLYKGNKKEKEHGH